MFGTALRLLGAQQALKRVRLRAEMGLERMGEQVQQMVLRYLVLALAGIAFLGAGVFGVLAGFWGFLEVVHDPAASAGIMAGILVFIGLLIALLAFGITQVKRQRFKAVERYPVQNVRSSLPTVEDVGQQIERAVAQYGPVQVTTAAVAAGLLAGLMAKRFRQI